VLEAGADGFTALNTIRAMAIDVYARKPVLFNVYGGYSGPAIKPIAVRVVYELYERFPRTPIIGVGGVDSWQAAIEFLLAGARAVGVGSAIAVKDLTIFREILEGLNRYLESEDFSSIEEVVGLAHDT
jgi:dihydroorotate oxidase B, catalytic subunit (EC 1.3.3.1)